MSSGSGQRVRFGSRIIARRGELGMSQRELAYKAFMSPSYLNRIETGYSQPPARDKIMYLAQALDLPEEELFGLASLEPQSPTKIIKRFPRILSTFQRVVALMSQEEISRTIGSLEKRIALFEEDQVQLADNFRRLLTGKLTITENPGGGMRPMKHYFNAWSEEIEEWSPGATDQGENREP